MLALVGWLVEHGAVGRVPGVGARLVADLIEGSSNPWIEVYDPDRTRPRAAGARAGESITRRIAGKKTKPFSYKDKGTMAAIGRGAACVQMLGGRTMTGKKAQLAWVTVHMALLPTNEDRAKALVDWAGATMTHQRSGRITVEST